MDQINSPVFAGNDPRPTEPVETRRTNAGIPTSNSALLGVGHRSGNFQMVGVDPAGAAIQ
jgi:hypothetical protein